MASSYPSSTDKSLEASNAQASAFLGRGTRVSGKIAFEGPARIEGQVEGEVVASESLLVGETAVLNAQISGGTVVIHGKVTGDINATKRLEIRAPGRVYGNVTTPSLVIEEGVVFEGHCSMGAAENRGNKVTLLAKEEKPSILPPPQGRPQGTGRREVETTADLTAALRASDRPAGRVRARCRAARRARMARSTDRIALRKIEPCSRYRPTYPTTFKSSSS
jgi:cytoskeletal protein CcmA (bactofilin family)